MYEISTNFETGLTRHKSYDYSEVHETFSDHSFGTWNIFFWNFVRIVIYMKSRQTLKQG